MTSRREIYGYVILDEIHELFPELLYDNIIFPHDESERILGWIRFRLSNLFPQTFNYSRQQYIQSLAAQRRNTYNDWTWLLNPVPRAPQQIIMSPLQSSLNTGTWGRNPILNDTMEEETLRVRNRTTNGLSQNLPFDDILTLTSLLISRPLNPLAGFYDPVIVRPTPEEIQNGTQSLDSTGIAADTICPICQDHDSPRDVPNTRTGWRRLIICQHVFHKHCIDRWFENHVICPICRADIRVTQQISSDPPGVESVEENVLSNQQ